VSCRIAAAACALVAACLVLLYSVRWAKPSELDNRHIAPLTCIPNGTSYYPELLFANVSSRKLNNALHLELWVPATPVKSASVPLMINLFSGGNAAGSRFDVPHCSAGRDHCTSGVAQQRVPVLSLESLLRQGIAVASIDYRLCSDTPETLWPGELVDAKRSVRWLRAHSAEFGLDPMRFGCFGFSSGGGLCSALALTIAHQALQPEGADPFDGGDALQVAVSIDGWVDFAMQEQSSHFQPAPSNRMPVCTFAGLTRALEYLDDPKNLMDLNAADGEDFGKPLVELLSLAEYDRLQNASLLRAVNSPPVGAAAPAPLFLATSIDDPMHPIEPARALAAALRTAWRTRFGRDLSDEELLVFVEIIESSPVGHTDCHPPATAEAAMAFVKHSLL